MIVQTPGGRYGARVKFRGVVVADRTFDRRADTLRWETEQKRLLNEGDYVPPSAGRITVKEVAEEYRESREGQVAVRSWESDESALRVHIVPALGKLPVSSVTPMQIERFLTDLATRRSVRTAARVRTTLRGLFAYAVKTRRIRRSPAADVGLPRADSRTGKVVEFEPFTLPLLLDVVEAPRATAGKYADLTLVLGLTGVRMGELRGLRVRDVTDVPYPGLVVTRSLPQSARTGRIVERATTKSGQRRVVPMSNLVQPVVAAWVEGQGPRGPALPLPGGRLPALEQLAPDDPLGLTGLLECDLPGPWIIVSSDVQPQAESSRCRQSAHRSCSGFLALPS